MCGIAGIWGTNNNQLVKQISHAQIHRGPDGNGFYDLPGKGALGHVRLAIMDPEYGMQPIHNNDNQTSIVANGMIYNHKKLRKELASSHHFTTGSDSETILHVFAEHELHTPEHLDGMFAFAICKDGELVLARDRIGIKPLYYANVTDANQHEAMVFASEIKALAKVTGDIHEFPPGNIYSSFTGFHQYYQVPTAKPVNASLDENLTGLRRSVEAAVEKRLLSDVPLGAFLSGGLDSSIIAAVASQFIPKLHTFSVGIECSRDIEAARKVAKHIGSTHHEYIYTAQEVMEAIPEIIFYLESYDQDLVRSAIPTWFCARLAREHVKVILTGEGADELFAGYTYHKDILDNDALHNELQRSVSALHNINLQRVDRMTMRHAIEARVPFLDTKLIEYAQSIPPELKLYRASGRQPIEKWILRKAFEDLLPNDIVWRNKEQFDEGSGMVDLLPDILSSMASGIDTSAYQATNRDAALRSNEECFYHKLLLEHFDRPEAIVNNVGRWKQPQLS